MKSEREVDWHELLKGPLVPVFYSMHSQAALEAAEGTGRSVFNHKIRN